MLKTLNDFDFSGKRVIIRTPFDIPIDDEGNITDDFRIKAGLPTIQHLLEKKAKIILIGHHHRPKGEVVETLKYDKVAERLGELLEHPVKKIDSVIGEEVREAAAALKEGEILMLENLRFDKREKDNDEYFARELASLADIYVNDAFSNSHREHASMVGIPRFIPGCVGLSVENELKHLTLDNPEKPFVVIMGGVKLETRIPLIENLAKRADKILLGGAMIFTFYKAQGFDVGTSIVDDSAVKDAKKILDELGDKLVLPSDVVIAEKLEKDSPHQNVHVYEMPSDKIGLDIGTESIAYFKSILQGAKTIVWNGPMGAFETEPFDEGTKQLAEFISGLKATTIVGGGDTAAAVDSWGLRDKMTHVSIAGGASLTMLKGEDLPAIVALEQNAELFEE